MDPLSISASIAGLIMITNGIVTNGFKYLSEFKQSDETVKNLFHEVNLLFGTSHSLQKVAIRLELEQTSPQHTTRIHHINNCDNVLRKIEAQLEHIAAKKNKSMDRARQRVLWPLSKAETKNLLAEVERQKTSLSLALAVDEMSALLNALASQDAIQSGLAQIDNELQLQRTRMNETFLSKRRQDIINSLNAVDYNQYQSANVRLRQAGTGGWFLDGAEFKSWLSADHGKLWLYGIPGAGKTVLMATIIQEVQTIKAKTGENIGMAFFFCDYKKPETHVSSTILGSLVKQFALQDDHCLHDLESFYEAHNVKGNPPQEVTPLELCNLLKDMALHFKSTMIIIDGLDEIETKRTDTIEILRSLTSTGKMKTLFASRDEVDIRSQLLEYANVSIAAQSGDLRLYVAAEIETRTSRQELRIRDPELKEHIIKTLITGAHGMFRWVACQMDYLCELNNDDDRRAAL
ncbi:hypothetical protein ONS95_003071 [Cadophora gregata]|uniref:uncharacterized protein n=1 Tax=Cadophora gregata TaxID=51156 RepID=UPI0026DBFD27|nr:uncharacterized protein ONS95_003071 [Cadophora gregata]KAK0108253.1 hypothetical protein ONS95_003071 [Cadophora gregata]KAK0109156.1 hypothetical protein ONS96_002980 [Cadophora gregata f. sp. sojae]